jgi:NTE family protein
MSDKKYRTGIVLSGGAARGFSHLGVLQALNESNIYPDIISGTSVGAIVGSLYADGNKPYEILSLLSKNSRLDYFSLTMPKEGLLQISGLIKILKETLRAKTFEELKIPLFVTATDLNNGRIVYFSSGELLRPVIASSSIPVLFKPLIIDNVFYVDGGVMNNMPIEPLENICEIIIGSYVNPIGNENSFSSLINVAVRTFQLSMHKDLIEKQARFTLLIAPPELKNYALLDPGKAEELFEIGYNKTRKELKNKELLDLLKR